MGGILRWLFAGNFMPHVFCLRDPAIVALHAFSDGLIAASYFLIPCALMFLVRRRRDLAFRWVYVLFGVFILACGSTHILAIVTLWHPVYRLEGVVRAITALASLATAVILVRLVPMALAIPGPAQFKREIEERRRAEAKVASLNAELEIRVRERTAQLEEVSAQLAEFAATLDKTQAIIQKLDGTIVYWNSGDEALYGWSAGEAIGRRSHELLQTEFPQPFEEIQAELFENGSWTGEFRQRCRDGSTIWLAGCWALYRDAGRSPVSVVAVNNDITELKRAGEALRNSEATARALFENASQGILTADREGRIVDSNAMAQRLFGYARHELVGVSVEMLLPEGLRERHVGHRAGYSEQLRPRTMGQGMDLVARRKDGSEFPVEISLSYVEHQSRGLAMAFISDITARLETSRVLVANNRDLERALTGMREASEHKSRFMANMSHELRTPLNSIIGFTEILYDKRAGEINAIQEEFLGDSLRSAGDLLALINDILDLEKIAAGRTELTLERFDLHALVRETVHEESVTPAAKRKRILVELDETVQWVFLDRQKTKQILLNLVTNAVKFTPEGGLVVVRVRPAGAERWILEVEDTGIGISEADQMLLFREFEQLETTMAKRFQGTGLGLALTRHLVEAQGGSMAVASCRGVGSTFSAMLPIALERRKKSTSSTLGRGAAGAEDQVPAAADDVPKPLMGPQETVSLPAPGGEPWVLVVDEDPGIQMQVGSALREWGFHVVGCRSGDAGLKAISRGLPAAAIVDLLLPNLDGFSFIARLQDIPSARGVPIVVWTNLDLEKHEMDALLRDVRQVISKRDGGFERLIHELRQVLWEFQVEAIGP